MGTGKAREKSTTATEVLGEKLIDDDSYIYSDTWKALGVRNKEIAELLPDLKRQVRELDKKEESEYLSTIDEDEKELWELFHISLKEDSPELVSMKNQVKQLEQELDDNRQELKKIVKSTYIDRGANDMPKAIPATQSSYKGFSTTSTGMSYYDDFLTESGASYMLKAKGLKAYIAEMSPKEYLTRCAKEIFRSTIENQVIALSKDNLPKYKQLMQSGTKFDMPVLNYANTTQEGRHRAYVANELGIKKIPVLIVEEA